MKTLLAFIIISLSPFSLLGQQNDTNKPLSSNLSLTYDNTLLNHPLQFSKGFNLRFGKTIFSRINNHILAIGSFGLISTPEIDNRLLLGFGFEYQLAFLKRFEFSTGIQGNYVLNILSYEVYEYSDNGQLSNKGNLIHQFRPSIHSNLGFDFLQKKTYHLGLIFEIRFSKLNESYTKRFTEGFVPTLSLGIKIKF